MDRDLVPEIGDAEFELPVGVVLHTLTTSLMLDQYGKNNPWHAEGMSDSSAREARRILAIGLVAGLAMGAVFGGVAWGITKLMN